MLLINKETSPGSNACAGGASGLACTSIWDAVCFLSRLLFSLTGPILP
jgi:hypothetical protein